MLYIRAKNTVGARSAQWWIFAYGGIKNRVWSDGRRGGSELLRLQLLSEDFRPAHIAVGDVLQIGDFGR